MKTFLIFFFGLAALGLVLSFVRPPSSMQEYGRFELDNDSDGAVEVEILIKNSERHPFRTAFQLLDGEIISDRIYMSIRKEDEKTITFPRDYEFAVTYLEREGAPRVVYSDGPIAGEKSEVLQVLIEKEGLRLKWKWMLAEAR